MKVYLDNAATTPIDKEVIEVMMPILQEGFGNPSSIHSFGRVSRSIVEKARKNVLIGFAGFLFMTVIMLITIGFKPSANDWSQDSLANVFTPMSRFFIASMIAYLASQYFDVWIYSAIKNITKNRYLWLRNNLSTILSSLVDNTIFSLLAWIILNPNPETLYNVIMIYIFGTYVLRIFIAFVDTPFMYFSKLFLPKNND